MNKFSEYSKEPVDFHGTRQEFWFMSEDEKTLKISHNLGSTTLAYKIDEQTLKIGLRTL